MTSAKKRILLMVTQADWGGVQSFLCRFAQELVAEGHDVLLAAGGEGELWTEARRRGITCHQFRHVTREISPYHDVRAIFEISSLIADFRPDAIHLNSSKMGVLGALAARHSRARVVYRIGGWSFLDPQPEWKRWIYRTAEKLTAPLKDIIITVHPGDEQLARERGFHPRKRLQTVANGIDLPAFLPTLLPHAEARERLGLQRDAFVFGTVANAYATKGLLDYLDVLHNVLTHDHGTHAVIIGDGPEFAELTRKRDRLGLQDRVTLTGHRDDAASLYAAFDAFVLPSKKEGMPWTLLEAMSAGLPCIATDVGACRWMLTDHGAINGMIVPPRDPLALAEAMHIFKTDQARRMQYARSVRESVWQRFTWETTYRGNRDALIA